MEKRLEAGEREAVVAEQLRFFPTPSVPAPAEEMQNGGSLVLSPLLRTILGIGPGRRTHGLIEIGGWIVVANRNSVYIAMI